MGHLIYIYLDYAFLFVLHFYQWVKVKINLLFILECHPHGIDTWFFVVLFLSYFGYAYFLKVGVNLIFYTIVNFKFIEINPFIYQEKYSLLELFEQ